MPIITLDGEPATMIFLGGHTAGTGFVAARDRRAIRPMPDIARDGLWHDANGYPIMALWLACFMQAYEATHLQG